MSASSGWVRSAVLLTASTMLLQAVNFLSAPVFSHLMPVGEYGIAANYVWWFTLLGTLIGLGLPASFNTAGLKFGSDAAERYLRGVLPMVLAVTVLLLVAAGVAWRVIPAATGLPSQLIALSVVNGLLFAITNLRMSQSLALGRRLEYVAIQALCIGGSVAFGLLGVTLLPQATSLGRILGYLTAYAAGALLAWLWTPARAAAPSPGYRRWALLFALPLLAHEMFYLTISQSGRAFLNSIRDSREAGIFAFAGSLASIVLILCTTLNGIYAPWYFAHREQAERPVVQQQSRRLLLVSLVCTVGAIAILPDLLLLMPRDYRPGAPYVGFVAVSGLATLIFNMSANYFLTRQRSGLVMLCSGISAVAAVVGLVTLIPSYGILAAATVTGGATTLLALIAMAIAYAMGCRDVAQGTALASLVVVWGLALVIMRLGMFGRLGLAFVAGLAVIGMFLAWKGLLRRSAPVTGDVVTADETMVEPPVS